MNNDRLNGKLFSDECECGMAQFTHRFVPKILEDSFNRIRMAFVFEKLLGNAALICHTHK